MNEDTQEILYDLLTKRASYGLDPDEQKQLDDLCVSTGFSPDESFDLTASAIGLIDLEADEPMPADLFAKISADAEGYFARANAADSAAAPAVEEADLQPTFAFEPKRSFANWLGWIVAAAACVALAVNILYTKRDRAVDVVTAPTPAASPEKLDPAKEFEKMVALPNVVRASIGAVPKAPTELAAVAGDVVWSDEKQQGYIKVRGLPRNDHAATCYQLWIVDETQDAKTPIDGGIFDITSDGEVVIAIDAKLRAKNPKVFAITIEKAGGVVVSDGKKMAAVAQVGKT